MGSVTEVPYHHLRCKSTLPAGEFLPSSWCAHSGGTAGAATQLPQTPASEERDEHKKTLAFTPSYASTDTFDQASSSAGSIILSSEQSTPQPAAYYLKELQKQRLRRSSAKGRELLVKRNSGTTPSAHHNSFPTDASLAMGDCALAARSRITDSHGMDSADVSGPPIDESANTGIGTERGKASFQRSEEAHYDCVASDASVTMEKGPLCKPGSNSLVNEWNGVAESNTQAPVEVNGTTAWVSVAGTAFQASSSIRWGCSDGSSQVTGPSKQTVVDSAISSSLQTKPSDAWASPSAGQLDSRSPAPFPSQYTAVRIPLTDCATATSIVTQFVCQMCDVNRNEPLLTSGFHSHRLPAMSVKQYMERIARYSQCSGEALLCSLVLLLKYAFVAKHPITVFNAHRLLITSIVLGIKLRDDIYFTNTYYGKIGGLPAREMQKLERIFLQTLDWEARVTEEEYATVLELLNVLYTPPSEEVLTAFAAAHREEVAAAITVKDAEGEAERDRVAAHVASDETDQGQHRKAVLQVFQQHLWLTKAVPWLAQLEQATLKYRNDEAERQQAVMMEEGAKMRHYQEDEATSATQGQSGSQGWFSLVMNKCRYPNAGHSHYQVPAAATQHTTVPCAGSSDASRGGDNWGGRWGSPSSVVRASDGKDRRGTSSLLNSQSSDNRPQVSGSFASRAVPCAKGVGIGNDVLTSKGSTVNVAPCANQDTNKDRGVTRGSGININAMPYYYASRSKRWQDAVVTLTTHDKVGSEVAKPTPPAGCCVGVPSAETNWHVPTAESLATQGAGRVQCGATVDEQDPLFTEGVSSASALTAVIPGERDGPPSVPNANGRRDSTLCEPVQGRPGQSEATGVTQGRANLGKKRPKPDSYKDY